MTSSLMETISKQKEVANMHFMKQNYDEALLMYSHCIENLEEDLKKVLLL